MNLLPEQQEILVNFQAITENWDTESSLLFLERNNWNLELATNDFLSAPSFIPNTLPQVQVSPQRVQLPLQVPPRVQSQPAPQAQPKRSFFSKVKGFFNEMISAPSPIYCQAAEDFRQKILSQGPSIMAPFSSLLLKDVITEGKRQNKLLLIYLSSLSVPLSYSVQVLCNPEITNLIYQYFVIWAVERETTDGQIADRLLMSSNYPCIAIVSVDNPSRPVVLSKLEGQYPVEAVLQFLSAQFTPIRSDPRQSEFDRERKIRAQQEAELREAELILEQRKIEEKRIKEEELRKKEEERIRKEKEEKARKEKLDYIGEEPEGPDSAHVLFRLPDGSKIERRFDKRRTVGVLYDFLEVQGICDVEILFGFPAVILNNRDVLLCDAGIFPKALVIARKIED